MKLKDIKAITRPLSVNFGDIGTLEIEYRPAAVSDPETIKMTDRMPLLTSTEARLELLAEYFLRIVTWWDLYDDDKPVPLSVEAVKELPTSVITTVLSRISEDNTGTGSPVSS
jgi:hypothetical protein